MSRVRPGILNRHTMGFARLVARHRPRGTPHQCPPWWSPSTSTLSHPRTAMREAAVDRSARLAYPPTPSRPTCHRSVTNAGALHGTPSNMSASLEY